MPHGYCIAWMPEILWPWVIGNILTALSYFTIPFLMYKIARVRKDIKGRMRGLFYLYAAFILFCGFGHVINTLNFWYGWYQLESTVAFATGVVSMFSAIALAGQMPAIMNMPSREDLENSYKIIQRHKDELQSLRQLEKRYEFEIEKQRLKRNIGGSDQPDI